MVETAKICGQNCAYKNSLGIFLWPPNVAFFVREYGHFCQQCPSLCAQYDDDNNDYDDDDVEEDRNIPQVGIAQGLLCLY